MRRILIIGGTGTISLPTTLKLAENPNNSVTVLNRGTRNELLPDTIQTITGDINDSDKMRDWLSGKQFDSVINFIIWNEDNAEANINIFSGHINQFIYISTVATLDHQQHCIIDEETPRGNRYSTYGQNKAAAELRFLKAFEEHGFPITIVRPTQTYSKERIPLSVKGKQCWTVIQRMIEGKEVIIHGEGQSVWASTHAEDFASGIVPIVANTDTVGEIYQIMNPETHTWDKVYQLLAQELGVEYRPVYIPTEFLRYSKKYNLEQAIQGDKRWSNVFDISKLLTINPTFKCDISLEKGLKGYLTYMSEHSELQQFEEDFDQWCDETIAAFKDAQKVFLSRLI